MILNISHMTLRSRGVEAGARVLERVGFKPSFVHETLPNAEEKKPFLSRYLPTHALSFCRRESGIPIELVDHFSHERSDGSTYQLLFSLALPFSGGFPDGWPSDALGLQEIWQKAFGCSVDLAFWQPFETPYWYCQGTPQRKVLIQAALLRVQDLSRSLRFWIHGVGCHLIRQGSSEGRRWARVAFATPLSAEPFDLVLAQQREDKLLPHLDDPGFACVAFLTVGLEGVMERLKQEGATAFSDLFFLEVGGKTLCGRILRGPDGELIEIIEFERQKASCETHR